MITMADEWKQTGNDEVVAKLAKDVARLRADLKKERREDSVSIVCFSGEWDKLFATFTIANGALALGQEVHLFFTFWGATALRKAKGGPAKERSGLQKMLGWMLPSGIAGAPLSKMNFCGLGKFLMTRLLRQKGVDDLQTLVTRTREMGAHFHCCDTSLQLFGWSCADLEDGDSTNWCGVTSFLAQAMKGKTTLFI
jgi:peroxiredoxin family protein